MTPAVFTLSITRGLPLALELEFYCDDLGASPVDLTGCTITAAMRPAPGADPKTPLVCQITDASAGKVSVTLEGSATSLLPTDPQLWDLVIAGVSGAPVPVLTGPVEIHDNATL